MELIYAVIGLVLGAGLVALLLSSRAKKQAISSDASAQSIAQITQLMQSTQAELSRQRDSLQQELARQRESAMADQARLRQELSKQLGSNQDVMQRSLSEANQTINVRLNQASKMFNEISKGLGTVGEFSKQLSNLRDVFHSPKLRGNIGEEVLKGLLEQVLPKSHFAMQFKFKEGQVVDAIVKTKQGLIPIDSKFPLENFRAINEAQRSSDEEVEAGARRTFVRDIKKHVDAIQGKYILPEEGTVDFAVMYVPSEAVYFEIVQNSSELIDYASEAKVYLVSPNTFYYFLKVILIGLEGARMEEMSRKVLNLLRTVQKDAGAFGEELGVLTRHITNAKNAGDRVSSKFERLSGSLDHVRLMDTSGDAHPPAIPPVATVDVAADVTPAVTAQASSAQQLTIDVTPTTDD